MRLGVLILSCALHGAAVVAALAAGVHVGRRLPAPAVRIEASVPASPAPPPALPAPALVVEAVVDALGGPLLPAEVDETVAPLAEPVVDLAPRPPTAPPPLASLRRAPPPAAAVEAVEAAPEVPAERCADNDPPRYPEHDRQRGHEGTVVVAVSVAADGRVLQASLRSPSPFPGLNREALRAVRSWRFTPARRGGVAVASDTTVTIVFRLRDERGDAVR